LTQTSARKICDVDAVEKLVAVQAVRDLVVTYAMAFDDHDWARLGSLWTEDAAFVVGDQAFEGREAVMSFLSTCVPDDYEGKHLNTQTLVQLAEDGQSAIADTDVVWIPQNFQNTILARYHDDVVKLPTAGCSVAARSSRWQYRPGPPPMSEAAMTVSSTTMLSGA
jgi:uncharacterized protein (TIGR02246 family)